jgi:16S rRNA (guanine966-N2)-methyltransferase
VKQRIFDLLPLKLTGFSVLDLFAGTGALGLEALSREAERVVFVDASKSSTNLILRNVHLCRLEQRAQVITAPVMRALGSTYLKNDSFHLALMDPPYDQGWVDRTLARLSETGILRPSSEVVVEHSPRERPLRNYGPFVLHDQRRVGQTWISFFTHMQ